MPSSPSASSGFRSLGGNVGQAQTNAILDSTPPNLTVISPAPLLVTNATTLDVSGIVTDASPLTLIVNGLTVAVGPDGAFTTTIPAGAEGVREITFVATDAASNQTTQVVSVVIDRTPPALTIASPLQDAVIPASSVSVSGTVVDATSVSVSVQGSGATVIGQAFTTMLSGLNDGPLTVTVRAVDAAGNESTTTRAIEIDLGPPTVTITSPAPGTITRQGTAVIAYSILDRSHTSILVNDVAAGPDCPGIQLCDRTQSVSLEEGDNTFTVAATDAGGRTTMASITITRDSTPPVADLQTPETISRSRPGIASGSATDTLAMESLQIRQGTTVICSGVAQGQAGALDSCSGAIPLAETAHAGDSLTITLVATDRAGNVTITSRTVRVTADGVVTGTVLNDQTSLPLAGATVSLLSGSGNRSTTTDLDGRYNLPVADISAALHIEKTGFTSVDRVVTVGSGVGTVPLDARLTLLADATADTPVIPSVTPSVAGAAAVPGPVSIDVLAGGSHRVTLLSAQGLPNLLPLGFSPLIVFNWVSEGGVTSATASFTMPLGVSAVPDAVLVRYDTAMRDWRIVAVGLLATDGALVVSLSGTGSYALVVPDAEPPAMVVGAIGAPLPTLPMISIPATATSESRVDPAVLPPTGGTATGFMRLDSPTALPSGTIVQADVEETYTLSSGEEASAPKRSMDVVAYKYGSVSGSTSSPLCVPATIPDPEAPPVSLCASFPITPSRTYSSSTLRDGRVHLDLLAGRESARGLVGGNAATTVVSGQVRLSVAAASLSEDTAIALYSYDGFSPFIPTTNGITPLQELTVDLSATTLNTSASLTFLNVAAAAGDTLVVARVDRAPYDGFPRLQVVALAQLQGLDAVSSVDTGLPGVTLEGIRKDARYVLLRLAGPVGFIAGTVTAGSSPVRALVSTNTLPFVATSTSSGYYAIPSAPGPVTVTARVLGQSLVGTASTAAVNGTPTALDIALQGTVTQATITPTSGTVGVEVNESITLTSPVALDATAVTVANISLRTVPANPGDPSTPVTLRLVLSGSGQQLSIIPTALVTTPPTPALQFSTNYVLEIAGLLDTVGGVVTAPTTTFRTKDDIKPVYDLKALQFSFPDAQGLVTVSAPNGTFPPGTTILIINGGNGIVLGLTAGNDGQVAGEIPAATSDRLLITVTDPFENSVTFERSQYTNPLTGETAIGTGGGIIEGPSGAGLGLDIPDGALDGVQGGSVTLKIEAIPASQYPTVFPRDVLTNLLGDPTVTHTYMGVAQKLTADKPVNFTKEVDVRFPLPDFTQAPADQRPAKPEDAFFYIYRKAAQCPQDNPACAEADKAITFEVIDEGKVQCKLHADGPRPTTCDDTEKEVVTASPPFSGLVNVFTDILFYVWSLESSLLGRANVGLITGTVRRQAYEKGQLVYKPVSGAKVSGVSGSVINPTNGLPMMLSEIEGNRSVTTNDKGTYAFWDERFTGGTIEVAATLNGTEVHELGFEAVGTPTYPKYAHQTVINLTFPAEAPLPPTPDIEVTLLNADGTILRGIAPLNVPLQVGFKSSIADEEVRILGAEINGEQFAVRASADPRFDLTLDRSWSPSTAGTYRLEATASRPLGGLIQISKTFRIVAAGGSVDTDNNSAPSVIDGQTVPKRNAKGVSTSAFISLAFSEPVKGIPNNITLTEDGATAQIKITGVTPQGDVIEDIGNNPNTIVTSVTIQPLLGFKFGAHYIVKALAGIQDLDTNAQSQSSPKNLSPVYETSFDTFAPELIPTDPSAAAGSTGFAVATDESGEPVSAWFMRHYPSGIWFGSLIGTDLTDPANPTEYPPAALISGRPTDVAAEGMRVVVSTTTGTRDIPSNIWLYDVTNGAAAELKGVATVAGNSLEGTPLRLAIKGNRIYAGTMRKGIQVIDADQLTGGLSFADSRAVTTPNDGVNQQAVLNTIPIPFPGPGPAVVTGIKATDIGSERVILATGNFGFAVAIESQNRATFAGMNLGGTTLQYGQGVAVGSLNNRTVAAVIGLVGGVNTLLLLDISDPLQDPSVLGQAPVPSSKDGINYVLSDVLIEGSTAYVGMTTSSFSNAITQIFNLFDNAPPLHVGTLEGIGGRLAISNKILYGSVHSTFGTGTPLAAVKLAALDTVALMPRPRATFATLIPATQSAPAMLETKTDIPLRVQIVPSPGEASVGTVNLVNQNGVLALTVAGVIVDATGRAVVNVLKGLQKRLDDTLTVYYIQQDQDRELRSKNARVEIGRLQLRVDSNNDTKMGMPGSAEDIADEEAAAAGKAFQFWEGDSAVKGEDALVDYARVDVQSAIKLESDRRIGMRITSGNWQLISRISKSKDFASTTLPQECNEDGKLQLCYNAAVTAQLLVTGDIPGGLAQASAPTPTKIETGLFEIPKQLLKSGLDSDTNHFLFRCLGNPNGSPGCGAPEIEIGEITGERAPYTFAVVHSAKIDIKPFTQLASAISLRRSDAVPAAANADDDHYKVSNIARDVVGWTPIRSDAREVTFIVHGYAVSKAEFLEGENGIRGDFQTFAKRLYWAGQKILQSQDDAQIVGISWPGNVPGRTANFLVGTASAVAGADNVRPYLAEDIFNAFLGSISLGAKIAEVRARPTTTRINILAHSLGNLLVNSALKEMPQVGTAPISYVMNEAAVGSEAFEQNYDPVASRDALSNGGQTDTAAGLTEILTHAAGLGYPFNGTVLDKVWRDQQDEIDRRVSEYSCTRTAPSIPPDNSALCSGAQAGYGEQCNPGRCDVVTAFYEGMTSLKSYLGLGASDSIDFTQRWSAFNSAGANGRPGGAWTQEFNDNTDETIRSIRLYNTYNRKDFVLRIDRPTSESTLVLSGVPVTVADFFSRFDPAQKGADLIVALRADSYHAWKLLQMYAMPFGPGVETAVNIAAGRLFNSSGATDDITLQKWWKLDISGTRSFWRSIKTDGSVSPLADQQLSVCVTDGPSCGYGPQRLRRWAELASWYPVLSVPAGAGPLRALSDDIGSIETFGMAVDHRNIDFETIGGEAGPQGRIGTPSHSYLFLRNLRDVWKGYRVIQQLFAK